MSGSIRYRRCILSPRSVPFLHRPWYLPSRNLWILPGFPRSCVLSAWRYWCTSTMRPSGRYRNYRCCTFSVAHKIPRLLMSIRQAHGVRIHIQDGSLIQPVSLFSTSTCSIFLTPSDKKNVPSHIPVPHKFVKK